MSAYPIWWDSTITIYNKFEDAQTHVITWYKTVVNGTFWKYVKNTLTLGNENVESESIICRIREDDRFLKKSDWIQVPNDNMNSYFTLARGDIIVKGEVDDTISEYTDGQRSTDLINKYKEYDECMEIDTVSINVGTGRGLPHYAVRGL